MGSGFAKMKKKQKEMQEQMAKMQVEMDKREIIGNSEGNLVKVVLTGAKALKKITIDPSCVDADDVEGLEDLIASAFKDAEKKSDESMDMPGMSGIPNMGNMF